MRSAAHRDFEDEEHDYDSLYVLNIRVKSAMNVDQETKTRAIYCVIVSDGHGREARTGFVEGCPLAWECDFQMQFPHLPVGEFLYVELLRVQSKGGDPGTSSGVSVVGRVKIPVVPDQEEDDDDERDGRMVRGGPRQHELTRVVGLEKRSEGSIYLHLELRR